MTAPAKTQLWTMSATSSVFTAEPDVLHLDASVELTYSFAADDGTWRETLRFERARSYLYTADGHCTIWQIADAYDTLVEIAPSPWVEQLRENQPRGKLSIRHFMIFIDDWGCLEVAAESYRTTKVALD